MSNFVATHRTREGLKVRIVPDGFSWRVHLPETNETMLITCNGPDLLFEPIPPPAMVTMTVQMANAIYDELCASYKPDSIVRTDLWKLIADAEPQKGKPC